MNYNIINVYQGRIIKTCSINNNIMCVNYFYTYGKIVFGMKEKTILYADASNVLGSFGFRKIKENPFLDNEDNYILDSDDMKIYYRNVTKMLTNDLFNN